MSPGHQGPGSGVALMSSLSLIVAVAENGVIGKDGDLPWRLPADLQRFKKRTMGKPIVMGRKTHESIGRPLPGRPNWVLTRNPDKVHPECETFQSMEALLQAVARVDEAMIIGGAEIYKALLGQADRLYLTVVHASPDGDAFFPGLHGPGWKVCEKATFAADEKNAFAQTELVLERRSGVEVMRADFTIPKEWLSHAN